MEKRRKKITFRDFKKKHNLLNSINSQFLTFKPHSINKNKFVHNNNKGPHRNFDINDNDFNCFFNRRKKEENKVSNKASNKVKIHPESIELIHNFPLQRQNFYNIVDQNIINKKEFKYHLFTDILNTSFDYGYNPVFADDESPEIINNIHHGLNVSNVIEESDLENQDLSHILGSSISLFKSDDTINRRNEILDKYNLIERKFGDSEFDENNKKCVICLEDYCVGDIIIFFPCRHSFHKKCIYNWFQRKETCPLCNLDIRQLIKLNEDAN